MTPLVGPGAAIGKNWDAIEDTDQTTASGDQSNGLPEIGSFVLYKIEPPLKEKEDFDEWYDTVTRILEGHSLHRLIDKNIERPDTDSEDAEKWMKLSIQVRAWLRHSIDSDVVKDITSTGQRTKWADDFMYQCKLQMRGEGHGALGAAMLRFLRTKRDEFSTNSEFITGLKSRYITANELKAGLSPYLAIVMMVDQLQEIPELRASIDIKENELKTIKDPATTMTVSDFFTYCKDMLDKIKRLGLDGGVGASSTRSHQSGQPKNQKKTDNNSYKKGRLMNAPPPGKHARDHVKEWKNHKTQRSTNGACSYCGTTGHDAKDCYHLTPESRPSGWKPKPGLWYYKTYKEFKEDRSQQFTGKPTERTKQANFDAVATSAIATDDDLGYDFGEMAVATDDREVDEEFTIEQRKGIVGTAVTLTTTRQLRSGIDWILDSGSSWHICTNKNLFVTYTPYKEGTGSAWDTSDGKGAVAEGHGDIILPIRRPKGGRCELRIHCEYKPGNRFNLLGLLRVKREQGIRWNDEDMLLTQDNKAIGYTFIAKEVPFIELFDEPNPVQYRAQYGVGYIEE
ncbi:uncharacterized protein N7479_001747 [Penicillium vulpinum]|uniref:CCHC-type domain-containing protein n=1 Tax=Penicillium vulpinum TaxID=29845 RepID=A0A1V6QYA2_9EURO|nr:uncharacterized protein N7479_001747 [Penicillium vulpinum]KAJ5971829.1 hypothetical protein N7479_001747 [Penicillium vulpinum]OQD94154.1 hypothetical protein PENVUL_c153G02678 [Penicillium vulpinum]